MKYRIELPLDIEDTPDTSAGLNYPQRHSAMIISLLTECIEEIIEECELNIVIHPATVRML